MNLETSDRKQFCVMLCIAFFIYSSTQMIGTTIAPYADNLGATTQYIGIITGSFGLMALLPRPISGQIVDKENNKLLMFLVLLACVASCAILLFAKTPVFLLLSRASYGLAWGVGSTLCLTNACNCLSERDMLKGISIYTMAQTLAMVLGPSLALWLKNLGGYSLLYSVCTILMLAAFCLVFLFKPKNLGRQDMRYSVQLRDMFEPTVLAPAALSICTSMINSTTLAFIVLCAAERDAGEIGWFFTVQALMILVFRPVLSRFITQKHLVKVALIANLILIVYLVVVSVAKTSAAFGAAAILIGVSMAASQPSIFNLCVSAVPAERRGCATNTNYAATDVGSFLGPWLSGILVGIVGYKGVFLLMALPLLVVVFACARYYHRKKIL